MAPTALAGRIDGPVPLIRYEAAREQILRTHTDLVTAQNAVARRNTSSGWRGSRRSARTSTPIPSSSTITRRLPSARSSACRSAFRFRSSTTTAATSSRPKRRWFGPAANTSGPGTICSPTWPIPSPVTRRIGKRPSSIAAVFSSTRCGPIAAPTSATRSIPTRISTTWSPRSRRWPATISTYIQLLGDQWQAVADLAGLLQSDDIFAMGQTRVRRAERVGRIPRPDAAQAPETRPEGRRPFPPPSWL